MTNIRITKRGKVYQYQFEIASVNGTRKYINKSGFKTKAEALEAGNIAYTESQAEEIINVGCRLIDLIPSDNSDKQFMMVQYNKMIFLILYKVYLH